MGGSFVLVRFDQEPALDQQSALLQPPASAIAAAYFQEGLSVI